MLEKIRCRFFWGIKDGTRGIAWGSWNKVCSSLDYGGLGVGSIRAMNLSLLGKWKWRFLIEKNALWRKVICALHGEDGGFQSALGL